MKHLLSFSVAVLGLASAALAAPVTFDFKDPKGVNAVSFKLDAVLEPIAGQASGVSGSVVFDPSAPGDTSGKIVVATKSLVVSNSTMTEHMLGAKWLDASANPEISFELGKLSNVKTDGNTTTAEAAGKLTIKGVTKEITAPVKLTYLADSFGKRIGKPEAKGDLLVVRSDFTIKRADFGIQPGQNEDKVSNEIQISLAVVGSAPKK